jgi:hypothetical protein
MKSVKVTPLRLILFIVALVIFNTATAGFWFDMQRGFVDGYKNAQPKQSFEKGFKQGCDTASPSADGQKK